MKIEEVLNFKPYRNLTCWTFFQDENFEYVKMFTPRGVINLNRIASLIWKFLDTDATINEIIQKIILLFPDTEQSLIKNDIIKFLNQFENNEIIILNWNPLQPYNIEKSKRRC